MRKINSPELKTSHDKNNDLVKKWQKLFGILPKEALDDERLKRDER